MHPIGESHPTRVDVRVIVATNADLEALVRDGRFREDLFYRLSIVRLHLPPLRERRVEIPTWPITTSASTHRSGRAICDCRKTRWMPLMLYRWPGNVRQLANEMRRIAALAETSAVLMPEHLSPEITAAPHRMPRIRTRARADRGRGPSRSADGRRGPPCRADDDPVRLEEVRGTHRRHRGDARPLTQGLYLKRQRFGIDPPVSLAAVAAGA